MEEFSLIKKFAEDCAAHPNYTAIIDVAKDTSMSYHELDVASGRVYRYLTERGIGKEDVVMILLPRGAKPFVTVVGVWKAGAAYVMLEVEYPEQKREFIKRDANCRLVIDENVFEEMMKCEVLEGYRVANPHDLSYIVYTSGTTGNPKGVMHEYGTQSLVAKGARRKYGGKAIFSYGDITTLMAPLNFTATIMTFHTVMYACATIIVLPLSDVRNIERVLAVINEYKVTVAFFTTSHLRLIPKIPECVKTVLVGAEPVNNVYYEGCDVYGRYGQSESGTSILIFKLDKAYEKAPAGKPTVPEMGICIQDENGNLVKDGEVGEICYHNPYFRGYLNLPEKNASVFRKGYVRSGDMAKILPDGNFLVLGRIDDMVKINGNRVEPAEIEVAVKHVLGTEWVGVRIFTEGQKSFVCAYYIGEPVLPIEDAKKIISEKLVPYMVPAFYIKIDKIPVSANGKFKRNDLPAPDFKSYLKDYVAPSNELEEKLCQVMASVLELERVGVTDDFYEIGGDSVNAIKVITKLNLPQLDVNTLFVGRTPAEIAKLYEEAIKEGVKSLDERNALELTKEHPISIQQQYVIDYQLRYPDSTMWNVSMLLKFGRDTDVERLKKAVDTAFKVHPMFSIVFAYNAENQLVQKYDANKIFDTKIEEISEADFARESNNLVRPFELPNKPMFRVRLFRTECGGYLFMDFHHSIVDGTSIHVLKNDICLAYEGKPLEPDYYFVFLDDQKKSQASPLREEGKEYYNNSIKKYEWDARLKSDFDTQENTYGNMTAMIPLDSAYYEKMREIYGLGKNAFFIAVTAVVMSTYNESSNIRVGWIYNGRETVSAQHAVGELLNYFYVGLHFDELKTLGALLEETARQVRNNVKYACCSYPSIEDAIKNHGDVNLIYQSNLRSLEAEGSLNFTVAELPGQADGADNLLDVEIHETNEGCKLYMDYNASVYKKESMERFKEMFIKAACALAQNVDNPDMCMMDIIKRIK